MPLAVRSLIPLFCLPAQGLCFKEGACYGKPESVALFGLVPLTLLGHLFGLPEGVQRISPCWRGRGRPLSAFYAASLHAGNRSCRC